MNGKKRAGITYKELGVARDSKRYGRLRLALRLPETGEVFLLRERVLPLDRYAKWRIRPEQVPRRLWAQAREKRMLNLMLLGKVSETSVGSATYVPLKRRVFLKFIETAPEHEKRGMASSLLAFIKVQMQGKGILLNPLANTERFYENLGFLRSRSYPGLMELRPGKPLTDREAKPRKFLIRKRAEG
jgi:hypothetical protein